MINRKKDTLTGKFTTLGEPNDQSLTIRVSKSLKKWLKETYGDYTAAFIRSAIAEKLERDISSQQPTAHEFKSSQLLTNS